MKCLSQILAAQHHTAGLHFPVAVSALYAAKRCGDMMHARYRHAVTCATWRHSHIANLQSRVPTVASPAAVEAPTGFWGGMFGKKSAAAGTPEADPWRIVAWLGAFADVVHAKIGLYFARPLAALQGRLSEIGSGGGSAEGGRGVAGREYAALLAQFGGSGVPPPARGRRKPDFVRAIDAFIYRMSRQRGCCVGDLEC